MGKGVFGSALCLGEHQALGNSVHQREKGKRGLLTKSCGGRDLHVEGSAVADREQGVVKLLPIHVADHAGRHVQVIAGDVGMHVQGLERATQLADCLNGILLARNGVSRVQASADAVALEMVHVEEQILGRGEMHVAKARAEDVLDGEDHAMLLEGGEQLLDQLQIALAAFFKRLLKVEVDCRQMAIHLGRERDLLEQNGEHIVLKIRIGAASQGGKVTGIIGQMHLRDLKSCVGDPTVGLQDGGFKILGEDFFAALPAGKAEVDAVKADLLQVGI